MKTLSRLEHDEYYLRRLSNGDVTEKYLKWVHDPEVTKYLEIRYKKYKLEDLHKYVRSFEGDDGRFLFGIFFRSTDEHIGNATVYDINQNVGTFDIGYFIGEKEFWGTKAGQETVLMLLEFGFQNLRLRKFFTGAYSNNIASRFILKKVGCLQEACLKERFLFEQKPVDEIVYSMDKKQWDETKKKFAISRQ